MKTYEEMLAALNRVKTDHKKYLIPIKELEFYSKEEIKLFGRLYQGSNIIPFSTIIIQGLQENQLLAIVS